MGRSKMAQPRRGLLPLITILIVALVTLACAWMGSGPASVSNRIVILTRLPTLTSTSLPTPTPALTSGALAMAAESAEATQIPVSATTGPPALDMVPAAQSPLPVSTAPPRVSTFGNEVSSAVIPAAPNPSETPPPSPTAVVTATLAPSSTPTALSTTTPLPSDTPTQTPQYWQFTGVRVTTDQNEGHLVLYGDVINNTGSPQELTYITGTFYNAQGQPLVIESTFDYWPVETIPPGGQVPFELTVVGTQSVSDFALRVEAAPSDKTPRREFELSELNQFSTGGNYCVGGKIKNLGGELHEYLAIIAVLYDAQDQVVNFSDYYHYSPQDVVGEQTLNFEVCVDPLNQPVSRYELRPWGL